MFGVQVQKTLYHLNAPVHGGVITKYEVSLLSSWEQKNPKSLKIFVIKNLNYI